MKKTATHPQVTIVKARVRLFTPILYAAIALFATPIYGASLRKVTRSGGDTGYDAAVNLNFDAINFELFNVMHKTGTEMIRGSKTFSDDLSMDGNKITNLANGSSSTDAAAFGQIPVVATQAEMEAATSNTVFVSPGVAQYHPGASKSWVVFTSTGTVAVKASHNVTSITDGGVGLFTLNFTTSFSSTFYACSGMADDDATVRKTVHTPSANPATAGAFSVNVVRSDTGAGQDSQRISVMCFGDQ